MPTENTPKRPRGRPETPEHLKRVRVDARIPRWILDWIAARPEGAGEVIAEALVTRHKLKPPAL